MASIPALAAQSSAPSISPTPPPWQRDLESVRLLEASLALSPTKDAKVVDDRERRIAQLYQELVRKYPDQAAVVEANGDYAQRHGQFDEAIVALRRAEALDPTDAQAASSLGEIYLHQGRTRDSRDEFQHAVNLEPGNAEYHFDLANVLYLFRHELIAPPNLPDADAVLMKSLGEYQQAAALAPHDIRLAQAYAETFYNLPRPDWDRALEAWENVLALSGPQTDFANSHLARISLRMKRPAEMENYLSRIQNPNFDELKVRLRSQAARLPQTPAPTP